MGSGQPELLGGSQPVAGVGQGGFGIPSTPAILWFYDSTEYLSLLTLTFKVTHFVSVYFYLLSRLSNNYLNEYLILLFGLGLF